MRDLQTRLHALERKQNLPVKAGLITMTGATTADPGHVLCNGQHPGSGSPGGVYEDLYNRIGTTYGGTGPTDFLVPPFNNLGLFPRGSTSGGATAGSDTHSHGGATGTQAGTASKGDTGADLSFTTGHNHVISSDSNVPRHSPVRFQIKY